MVQVSAYLFRELLGRTKDGKLVAQKHTHSARLSDEARTTATHEQDAAGSGGKPACVARRPKERESERLKPMAAPTIGDRPYAVDVRVQKTR